MPFNSKFFRIIEKCKLGAISGGLYFSLLLSVRLASEYSPAARGCVPLGRMESPLLHSTYSSAFCWQASQYFLGKRLFKNF